MFPISLKLFYRTLSSNWLSRYERDSIKLYRIVNSKLLKRHSKAKRRAPAYSRALHQIRGVFQRIVRGRAREAQVRFPEGERMRQIRGVFQRIVRGKLRSGCQKVRGD